MADNEKTFKTQSDSMNETRTGIMKQIEPVIEEALVASGLNLNNPDILRRYFRALVHVGAKRLLDAGAPAQFVAGQAIEAIGHELAEREAAGTALTAKAGDPTVEN